VNRWVWERYTYGGAIEVQLGAPDLCPHVRLIRNGLMLGLEAYIGNWAWFSVAVYRPPWREP
jgi:hypothetical protein